jgi:hypothetical protein
MKLQLEISHELTPIDTKKIGNRQSEIPWSPDFLVPTTWFPDNPIPAALFCLLYSVPPEAGKPSTQIGGQASVSCLLYSFFYLFPCFLSPAG